MVQKAAFYKAAHELAVASLENGKNTKTWLDVGCGAGIVANLAYLHGYKTVGVDINPYMIEIANKNSISKEQIFSVCDSNLQSVKSANIVSAASLLFVSHNKKQMLDMLYSLVNSSGKLLIIETTQNMTLLNALKIFASQPKGGRFILLLCAFVRNGKCIDDKIFSGYNYETKSLLPNNMLCVRIISKA
jgi:ubiquinone/menaquinone biosynthesis C-methylase UbiE